MLLSPFGPTLFKSKLPEKYRRALLDEAYQCRDDASPILVGQIEEQLYIYPDEQLMKPFYYGLREYMKEDYNGEFEVKPMWVNFQQAGDWQPVHNHDGDFSFVAYLDVPEGIYDEPEAAGSIYFTYGEKQPHSNSILGPVKPEKGDFWIFPAWMNHYVYPFKSGGQRISMSGNIHMCLEGSY